jgi:hypothetical protein
VVRRNSSQEGVVITLNYRLDRLCNGLIGFRYPHDDSIEYEQTWREVKKKDVHVPIHRRVRSWLSLS